MKYIVYVTTNLKSKVNDVNRVFIGVHKVNNPAFFDGYLGDSVYMGKANSFMYPKTPFQYAVKKYGVKAFTRSTLFVYDNKEDAYKKKRELVNSEFIKQPHTYNVKEDDDSKKLYQFDLNGNLVHEWDTITDARDVYSYPTSKFNSACELRYKFLDYYWSFTPEIDIKKYGPMKTEYIHLYSKDGKYLKEFVNKSRCAEYLGLDERQVKDLVYNGKLIKGKYYLCNRIVDIFIPRPRRTLVKSEIFVYDNKTSEFLGSYVGKKVFNVIGTHSFKKIYTAMMMNNGWYKGFYLSFDPVEKVPERIGSKRRIEVYTKDGNLIEVLESIKDLREKYNLTSAQVNKIFRGVKNHPNYIFMYSK